MFPNRIFYINEEGMRIYFDYIEKVDFNKIDVKTIHHHRESKYYCEKKRQNKRKRILFLGDSVTIGDGVLNKKKIYTYLLEGRINNVSKNKVKIINYAVTGYNLLDQITLLKTNALDCEPNLIIYPFYQNDIYDLTYYSPLFIPYLKYRYSKNYFHHFRTFYFFSDKMTRLKFEISDKKIDYEVAKSILNEMVDISKKDNIGFYIVNFPDIKEGFPSDNFIEDYANEKGVDYLDMRKKFIEKGLDPITLRAKPNDFSHYNYQGHEIIAEILHDDLLEKELIPK